MNISKLGMDREHAARAELVANATERVAKATARLMSLKRPRSNLGAKVTLVTPAEPWL